MAQRRTHKKSKLGCQNCKRRHIKCDEGRPGCINCSTTERNCVYLPARPRAIRSTSAPSPQSSTADAGTTSTTTSPSQTLGSSLIAVPSVVLTPSSFDASPISTPAPSIQYGTNVSSINVRHLELWSNFVLETLPSLDLHGVVDLELARIMTPTILSAPYLLLQVLALSALHLSHKKPEQADSYQAEATSLQIEALTSFDDYLGNINSSNCEAMLMFASLLGTHSLAEAVKASECDADGFLDNFVTYLNLHRGVQTVTSQAWALLMQSKMSPLLHRSSYRLDIAATQTTERADLITENLTHLLDGTDMNTESIEACRHAVSQLTLVYHAVHMEDAIEGVQQQPSGLIWAWPCLLSGTYTELLQKRRPEALIILCYYALLLHRRRNMWSVGNAGRMLIESVTKSLGSYWRHWLDLPNEIICE